ncbi:MAG: teicoplanin resistance protein VanZ, partial [Euryarchaeota archaeon]|nr:teicoplanin resistance protein VanZ [Marinobacter sp.]
RDFSLADLAADACGIGLGLLPWPIVREARKKGLRDSPNSV